MPDVVVLDASAALSVLRREPERAQVVRILGEFADRRAEVLVPDLLWLEVANVLIARYRYTPQQVVASIRLLDEFTIRTVPVDRPLWLLTLDRMQRHGLSAYDATYLALAESTNAAILTLDARLALAAGTRAVGGDPHRIQDASVEYVTATPSAVWATFGAYLAELREADEAS